MYYTLQILCIAHSRSDVLHFADTMHYNLQILCIAHSLIDVLHIRDIMHRT